MALNEWRANNWLTAHTTSPQEIRGHLAVVKRELADAQIKGLSIDARFGHAYNAALQSAVVALAAAGFRVSRGGSHHHYAIQSLAYTIDCDASVISMLDKLRKKRNISDYEQVGSVSEQEAAEMLRLAKDLRRKVEAWLRKEHPALLKG